MTKKHSHSKEKKKRPAHGLSLSKPTRKVIPFIVCIALLCLIIGAAIFVSPVFNKTITPNPTSSQDKNIAQVLAQHTTSALVGDKAHITSLKPIIDPHQETIVVSSCPSENDPISKMLQNRSFTYLLKTDRAPGYQTCSIEQTVNAYGRPNSSSTISGTLTNPKELLLFYDKGPGKSGPTKAITPASAPSTVVPVGLGLLTKPTCTGKTILSVVAHQDDDLLFMNPEHIHDIQEGDCLRTVYLTAGDAGTSSAYWLGRQKGSEAAYDTMIGNGPSLWIERIVALNNHEYITMAAPKGNPNVSIVFVHLPDGNVDGNGFKRTHFESIERLENDAINTIHTVDGQSSYTKQELISFLNDLMTYYQPNEVDTQTPVNESIVHADHPDHMATGRYVRSAYTNFVKTSPNTVPIVYYTGYPIDQMPQNIFGADLMTSSKVFYSYAQYDAHLCNSPARCANTPYEQWLKREYVYTP